MADSKTTVRRIRWEHDDALLIENGQEVSRFTTTEAAEREMRARDIHDQMRALRATTGDHNDH